MATYGPHVAFDCHVVVLCLQWGHPVQSKCIVHTSLYYTVAAVHSRECDRFFKFDKFLVSETHLSNCVSVRISPREGFQLGGGGFLPRLGVCVSLTARWRSKAAQNLYLSSHLKITQGLETGHGRLLGISGTEIK